jgi:hypothetical protein
VGLQSSIRPLDAALSIAAGPDGIRGSTPSQSSELKARTLPRVWPIPVTLFCHHINITLAIKLLAAGVMRPFELLF